MRFGAAVLAARPFHLADNGAVYGSADSGRFTAHPCGLDPFLGEPDPGANTSQYAHDHLTQCMTPVVIPESQRVI